MGLSWADMRGPRLGAYVKKEFEMLRILQLQSFQICSIAHALNFRVLGSVGAARAMQFQSEGNIEFRA